MVGHWVDLAVDGIPLDLLVVVVLLVAALLHVVHGLLVGPVLACGAAPGRSGEEVGSG